MLDESVACYDGIGATCGALQILGATRAATTSSIWHNGPEVAALVGLNLRGSPYRVTSSPKFFFRSAANSASVAAPRLTHSSSVFA